VAILVNATGITCKGSTLELYEADRSRVMETNLAGTSSACRSLAAHIRAMSGRAIFRQALMFRTSRSGVSKSYDIVTGCQETKNGNQS
jgi:NAD(P)-dependent dehydrogenase (short-subunit alcohol dehydrogenase family)